MLLVKLITMFVARIAPLRPLVARIAPFQTSGGNDWWLGAFVRSEIGSNLWGSTCLPSEMLGTEWMVMCLYPTRGVMGPNVSIGSVRSVV